MHPTSRAAALAAAATLLLTTPLAASAAPGERTPTPVPLAAPPTAAPVPSPAADPAPVEALVDRAACSANPAGPATLPFAVDLYGERVQALTVAEDGYVVAGDLLTTRSHQISFANLDRRIVAPYFTGAEITGGTAGWGTTTHEGRRAFCATWTDLTGRDLERANTFQLLLVERADRGEGAFDVVFGYEGLQWGYGRAGFSDGSGRPGSVVEIAGSGEEFAFLDTDPSSLARLSTRSDVPGRHVFAGPTEEPGPAPQRLVLSSTRGGNTDVYSTAADGTDLRRLTTHPAADSAPTLSADGRRVAFTSTRDGGQGVFTMLLDGSGVSYYGAGTTPSFTADGADVAYSARLGGADADVHVQSLDGTSRRQVTDAAGDELSPSFAPDGALVHTALVGQRIDVHLVEAAGARPRRLTTDAVAGFDPSFSPDGRRVLFTGVTDRNVDVWSVARGGGDLRRLTTDLAVESTPDHGADGRVVFASTRSGRSDLYVMAADGGGVRRLVGGPAVEGEPNW